MKIIGHRGAPFEALENSPSAFKKALDAGCHIIELDVWCAKDESLWVCHDSDLYRTSGLKKNIKEMTKTELSQIKLSNEEPLPSLQDAFDIILPYASINIEMKDKNKEAARVLLNFIKDFDLSKLIISCFYLEPLEEISKINPCVQLALLSEENNTYEEHPFVYLSKHPKWFYHPQADILTQEEMKVLRARGTTVYPWVSKKGPEDTDRESFWIKMKNLGIDGLCTNFPREFSMWLKKQTE